MSRSNVRDQSGSGVPETPEHQFNALDPSQLLPAGQSAPGRQIENEIFDIDVDGRIWTRKLQAISESYSAAGAAILHFDYEKKTGTLLHAHNIKPEFVKSYESYYCAMDDWFRPAPAMLGHYDVVIDDSRGEAASGRKSRFQQEWLAPQSIHHCIRGILERSDGAAYCLVLFRPSWATSFSPLDIDSFHNLIRPLKGSWQAQRKLEHAVALQDVYHTLSNNLTMGIAVVDRSGAILMANTALKGILAAWDGLSPWPPEALVTEDEQGGASLTAILAHLAQLWESEGRGNRPDQQLLVPRQSGENSYLLKWQPCGGGVPAAILTPPAALVSVQDLDLSHAIEGQPLRTLFGATGSEARLAAQLSKGRELKEIAAEQNCSYETLRSHLKSLFNKTGARRQIDLMRLLLKISA